MCMLCTVRLLKANKKNPPHSQKTTNKRKSKKTHTQKLKKTQKKLEHKKKKQTNKNPKTNMCFIILTTIFFKILKRNNKDLKFDLIYNVYNMRSISNSICEL